MEVVTPKEMQRIEGLAYADGHSEALFMEEAGKEVAEAAVALLSRCYSASKVLLLCGVGNNGGDAYVAGVHLLRDHDLEVEAIQLGEMEKASALCLQQRQRFLDVGGTVVFGLPPRSAIHEAGLLIDGLFGTGFHGEVYGDFCTLIQWANQSGRAILAVDIPSGLNGETGARGTVAIGATETVFLGLPKQGFFLDEGWRHVGRLVYGDFGIDGLYTGQAKGALQLLTHEAVASYLAAPLRDQHKYQAGYVVGIAGCSGMPGAALLASTAALRGGAGIVRLIHPKGMEAELSGAPYELIRQSFSPGESLSDTVQRANSVFVGPGLGKDLGLRRWLLSFLKEISCPLVIDADALNALADEGVAPPSGAILTPHRGEMQRLLGVDFFGRSLDDLKQCQEYCERHQVFCILKGGPTFLFAPGEQPWVLSFGHPGLATAGTGDVLTGIVAACLAKGLPPLHAMRLAVALHALAGEAAADEWTGHAMLASDLFDALPQAFRCLNPLSCL